MSYDELEKRRKRMVAEAEPPTPFAILETENAEMLLLLRELVLGSETRTHEETLRDAHALLDRLGRDGRRP